MSRKPEKGKDFDVIWWDHRETVPWEACVDLGRKFHHHVQADLGDDSLYVLFSNFRTESDEQVRELIHDVLDQLEDEFK